MKQNKTKSAAKVSFMTNVDIYHVKVRWSQHTITHSKVNLKRTNSTGQNFKSVRGQFSGAIVEK